jgi:hypothetical protein
MIFCGSPLTKSTFYGNMRDNKTNPNRLLKTNRWEFVKSQYLLQKNEVQGREYQVQ